MHELDLDALEKEGFFDNAWERLYKAGRLPQGEGETFNRARMEWVADGRPADCLDWLFAWMPRNGY